MPGIILDPRQYDREKPFGVIEIHGLYAVYDKRTNHSGEEDLHILPWGWKLDEDNTELEESNNVLLYWKGEKIRTRVRRFVSLPYEEQGRVTRRIKDFLQANPVTIFEGVDEYPNRPPKQRDQSLIQQTKELLDG